MGFGRGRSGNKAESGQAETPGSGVATRRGGLGWLGSMDSSPWLPSGSRSATGGGQVVIRQENSGGEGDFHGVATDCRHPDGQSRSFLPRAQSLKPRASEKFIKLYRTISNHRNFEGSSQRQNQVPGQGHGLRRKGVDSGGVLPKRRYGGWGRKRQALGSGLWALGFRRMINDETGRWGGPLGLGGDFWGRRSWGVAPGSDLLTPRLRLAG